MIIAANGHQPALGGKVDEYGKLALAGQYAYDRCIPRMLLTDHQVDSKGAHRARLPGSKMVKGVM
eukprot:6213489-Pleurochrysis_carterae.AAC.3